MPRQQTTCGVLVLVERCDEIGIDCPERLIGRREEHERAVSREIVQGSRPLGETRDETERGLRCQHISDRRGHRRGSVNRRGHRRRDHHAVRGGERFIGNGRGGGERGVDDRRPTGSTRSIGLDRAHAIDPKRRLESRDVEHGLGARDGDRLTGHRDRRDQGCRRGRSLGDPSVEIGLHRPEVDRRTTHRQRDDRHHDEGRSPSAGALRHRGR